MTDDPTVIANQAHLPGLRMPGAYAVDWDPDTGLTTVTSGSEAGTVFLPGPEVQDAMRRAVAERTVVNESLETYLEAGK